MSRAYYEELKKSGMMRQTQDGLFTVRLHVTGGNLDTKQLSAIQEAADRFGSGEIHLTSRQGVEIPNVAQDSLDALKEFLSASGTSLLGVCGPGVRTITACQGLHICPSGLIDAPSLARAIDREFYGKPAPHKFKIGITACPNNCLKAEENDFGIKGGVEPRFNKAGCTSCGMCETACYPKAISMNGDALLLDASLCQGCGKCITSCPPGCMVEEARGFRIYVGGNFGRVPSLGKRILPLLKTEDEVMAAITATLEFFREHGKPKERFRDTLQRTGFDALETHVKGKMG